ncbi:D-tagatose-bisphosphate aldolase, class II, non-catalytic subunit [Neptunicella marina]|uniref:D-tagatose-bisphosphate aldolase, class II, non-catalytic subunit n=1 Tax=Neptunicella marina TaxID=2125989 RepID=A0A8J6IUE8_9ALTE|nr:D-tagatose-bisphosphate aldolase, class II, non-catalytic subunit [Neptunicella marina]MBC3766529.1 D-tagatose-bisphosphate aldolase, class II, non-catalytic subunit [Neptunicella marina]
MKELLNKVKQHKNGAHVGIYSVCTANTLVIEAAISHALKHNEILLIEATSNQVNQDGGYTGMTPSDFAKMIYSMASEQGLSLERVILGGDHLGPNCWQDLPAAEAMAKSEVLIEQYVAAGFQKIHLDCSMSCKGDPVPLTDNQVAERAATLCAVAERTWQKNKLDAPVYVIGTEVPVPGGTSEDEDELAVTSVSAANQTIAIHQQQFEKAGLSDVWPRIIGLVVQPGVEFGTHKIIHFEPEKAKELGESVATQPNMVFEAHSTDYQSQQHLTDLVSNHFAILKVGPWLTFALREACFALERIEQEWVTQGQLSELRDTLLKAMQDNPKYWKKYYSADGLAQLIDCQYSLSDRIRYYWPDPEVTKSLSRLISNLDKNPPPLTLISQYMPEQYHALQSNELEYSCKALILHKISLVLKQYSIACGTTIAAI